MKIDLTILAAVDQVAVVMKVLQKRHTGGARATHASDLHRYCKHRAFRTQAQRTAHYSRLLNTAVAALGGDQAKTKKLFAELEAAAVIFESGDRVQHGSEECRVLDVLPEGKLRVLGLGGARTVLAAHCQPALAAN